MKGRTLLTEYNKVKKQRDELLEALKEIAKGEGVYDLNPAIHVVNCINNMKQIAETAINNCK